MNKESMDEYADDHPEYTGVKVPSPTKSVRDILYDCWHKQENVAFAVALAKRCGYVILESEVDDVYHMLSGKYGSYSDCD